MALLDSNELARELNVSIRTLDQWAYLGKGPAYLKLGKHRRYRREDIDAWLDERTVSTSAGAK